MLVLSSFLSFFIGVKEGREEEERERESEKPTILGQFSRADLSLDEEVVFGNEEVGGEEVRSGGVVDTGQCGVLVGTTRRLTELHHMDRGRETDRWSRKRGKGGGGGYLEYEQLVDVVFNGGAILLHQLQVGDCEWLRLPQSTRYQTHTHTLY